VLQEKTRGAGSRHSILLFAVVVLAVASGGRAVNAKPAAPVHVDSAGASETPPTAAVVSSATTTVQPPSVAAGTTDSGPIQDPGTESRVPATGQPATENESAEVHHIVSIQQHIRTHHLESRFRVSKTVSLRRRADPCDTNIILIVIVVSSIPNTIYRSRLSTDTYIYI